MATLAVIIVSWNVRELLDRCLRSVDASLAGSGIACQVVVVDNDSADGSAALVRERHPAVRLIEAGANLGFAGGNNLGLRALGIGAPGAGRDDGPDYVLLLNPDTEVVGDAIPRLVGYLEAHPDVAVVGPQLRYGDGSPQPSRRRFPTIGTYFWESTPLEQRWPGNPWARRYRMAELPDDREQEVGWLVGAALLVRRTAIERAGLLDEGFVMYSEELEWQRRIRGLASRATPHAAARIVYLPQALVIHYEGRSSEQAPARRSINFCRSRLRYARMAHGPAVAAALRLFLLCAYAAELGVETAKLLIGHRRDLRARRVAAYGELLGSLVRR